MTSLRADAVGGRAIAQTQLADYYLSLGDLTNAVAWYRRAAGQDHVPAQLSLAACLMSGRGAPRDPSAAARLLRRSADLIELADDHSKAARPAGSAVVSNGSVPAPFTNAAAPKAIVISRATIASSNAIPATNFVGRVPAGSGQGIVSRLDRVTKLATEEPALQETRATSTRAETR